jgi:YfiH family protein
VRASIGHVRVAFQFGSMLELPIRHAMSGRLNGAPVDGDVGHGPNTIPEVIEANRLAFVTDAGFSIDDLVIGRQTHSTNVAVVTAADRGRGLFPKFDGFPATDAMVTADPAVALGVIVADCVPVLLYDRRRHALGLAHAGWRGAVGAIAAATLQAMSEAYGTDPADIVAGIGPSIGPCCYEVGAEVIEAWTAAGLPDWRDAVRRGVSGYHFDLWSANRQALRQAGVDDRRIVDSAICVRCRPDRFFSYRATKQITAAPGRNLMIAQLLPR